MYFNKFVIKLNFVYENWEGDVFSAAKFSNNKKAKDIYLHYVYSLKPTKLVKSVFFTFLYVL